jgi:REP element-mobilizing transposase RayT
MLRYQFALIHIFNPMPVRTNIPYTSGIFFITFTCNNWLKLFETAQAYDCVYNWFNILKMQGHYIVGYTIMPNHLHAVIAFSNTGKSINTIVANGKRFMAYEMIEKLKTLQQIKTLDMLTETRNKTEIAAGKLHKVF